MERPVELSTDTAAKAPVIRHAVMEVERQIGDRFEVVVDLDVTAPVRLTQDIAGVVRLLETSKATNVITGVAARRSPYFNLVERTADWSVRPVRPMDPPITRRQDAPACFDMNASIYAWWRDRFVTDPRVFYSDTQLYEMPVGRSHDIDCEFDLMIVEQMFKRERIAENTTEGLR